MQKLWLPGRPLCTPRNQSIKRVRGSKTRGCRVRLGCATPTTDVTSNVAKADPPSPSVLPPSRYGTSFAVPALSIGCHEARIGGSDATGKMNLTKVSGSSPFSQGLLCTDDCFVLDNGQCGKIYVWKGRKANQQEREAALKVAEDFISHMKYSPKTQVEILPQGRESPLFKQFFASWK
ncbi:Macrophage-capping protein [Chelonia mydas]|uniref:Macrophage-capping protein n=1 Tax=Chelonia mydas TaxID=8469 RepID=M7B8R6_CHEMY|nr:Macrophage-capping protein [Chelonia mydas]